MSNPRKTLTRVIAFLGSATLASLFGINLHGNDKGDYSLFTVAHADTPTSGSTGGDSIVIGCDSCCGASNAAGDPGTADGGGGVDSGGTGTGTGTGSGDAGDGAGDGGGGCDGCCF